MSLILKMQINDQIENKYIFSTENGEIELIPLSVIENGTYTPEEEKTQFSQEYAISPEFIMGYLDIENKAIHINPLYNREHDYTGLIHDMDVAYMVYNTELEEDDDFILPGLSKESAEKEPSPEDILVYSKEELKSTLNSILNPGENGVEKEAFADFLRELQYEMKKIRTAIPGLKTNKDVDIKLEEERIEEQKYQERLANGEIELDEDGWNWNWDEEIESSISEECVHDINGITQEIKESEKEVEKEVPPQV